MKEKPNARLASFFNYNKEENPFFTDIGYETLQDFFLSWTFRCAESKYNEVNDLVHKYASRAIFALIFGVNNEKGEYVVEEQMPNSFIVEKVNVFRQWNNIDLLVDIDVQNGSESKKYILNIENKFYSNLRDVQLKAYRKAVYDFYQSQECEIVNLFIAFDTIKEGAKVICRQNGYKFLTCYDIEVYMKIDKETGNDLFDEFWIYF